MARNGADAPPVTAEGGLLDPVVAGRAPIETQLSRAKSCSPASVGLADQSAVWVDHAWSPPTIADRHGDRSRLLAQLSTRRRGSETTALETRPHPRSTPGRPSTSAAGPRSRRARPRT